MAERNQFGSANPSGGYSAGCLRFEAMLVDAADGTLAPEDETAFEQHILTCHSCAEMLASARRGAAWLELLRPFPPEPPTGLVDRILAQTSVQAAIDADAARTAQRLASEADFLLGRPAAAALVPTALSSSPSGRLLPFRTRIADRLRPALGSVLQTRFAMTAAMAFFSVALTLNLTGVHVSQLHARDLRPSNLRRTFFEADARLVRYYESFRVVYELESRVRDLQRTSDQDSQPREAEPATAAPSASPSPEKADPADGPKPAPHRSNAPAEEQATPHRNEGRQSRSIPAAPSSRSAGHSVNSHLSRPATPVQPPEIVTASLWSGDWRSNAHNLAKGQPA